MTKTAFLLTLILMVLASMPARAQRVFVSSTGLDTNPCTRTEPCRTFQKAFNTVPANGEIDVLDPADYGQLTITHGISIQGHGFAVADQAGFPPRPSTYLSGASILVNSTEGGPVTLRVCPERSYGIAEFSEHEAD
jgi:hypothetical protein